MTDGWIMDAAESSGWKCGETGCDLGLGHDDPQVTEHPTPHRLPIGRPKKYTEGRVTTTVRLAPDLLAVLDRLADERDVSRNWLITRLLSRGIESLPAAGVSDDRS